MPAVVQWLGGVALFSLLAVPSPLHACTCANSGWKPKDHLAVASSAFTGKVVSVDDNGEEIADIFRQRPPHGPEPFRVRVQVEASWKGGAEASVEVRTGNDSCGYPFAVGDRYLVFARSRDGELWANHCSGIWILESTTNPHLYKPVPPDRVRRALGEPVRNHVRGRVTSADGQAISSCGAILVKAHGVRDVVAAYLSSRGRAITLAQCDATGAFVLPPVASGDYYLIVTSREPHSQHGQLLQVTAGLSELHVTLGTGHLVSGTRRGIERWEWALFLVDGEPWWAKYVEYTDSIGYGLYGIPEGRRTICAVAAGYAPSCKTVVVEGPVSGIDFVLQQR